MSMRVFDKIRKKAYAGVMDERKTVIRELEGKKKADIEARNRLLEGLGLALLQRIGEEYTFEDTSHPSQDSSGDTPGVILAEYRGLQREIAESMDIIKSLEADIQRLKELEEEISTGEEEKSRLERELADIHVRIGKAFLEAAGFDDLAGSSRQQEKILQAKIDEQEKKLAELEAREGGVIAWVGINAQLTVIRALLLKNKSALERLYLSAGEKFLSEGTGGTLDGGSPAIGDGFEAVAGAGELKEHLASLAADLSVLKAERRKTGEVFGTEGAPSKRIKGLEDHITHVKEKFPAVFLRFGALAAEGETLASLLQEEDRPVLETAESLKSRIAERELDIEKINAAITIDNEKAEIEKMKSAILNQRKKIEAANVLITNLEEQIAGTEQHTEELKEFLRKNEKGKSE